MASRKRTRDSPAPLQTSDDLVSSPPANFLPSSPFPYSDLPGEEDLIHEDMVEDLDDDAGEDLFGSDMENDYQENIKLDTYEVDDIDDQDYEAMDIGSRAEIEARMKARDAMYGRNVPAAFLGEYDDAEQRISEPRRRRRLRERDMDVGMQMDDDSTYTPLEDMDMKGQSIAEWVLNPEVTKAIKREFNHFLLTYVDDHGNSVYGERIRRLGEINAQSLEVSYTHLADSKPLLAYYLANSPSQMLTILNQVAWETVLKMYPYYDRIYSEVHVRIADLPSICSLRDLRQTHLNTLVRVFGVVSRRTSVFPQLKYVKYDCLKCGNVLGPFYQDAQNEIKVGNCNNCGSKGPFNVNAEQTVYRNYQKITLQETPGTVPAGRLPRHREVVLLFDLIDNVKPGEEIEVTGIYKNNFDSSLNTLNGFPVFATILEANSINKRSDEFATFRLTEDDLKEIRNLAKDEKIGRRIMKSIAPSIYGHDDIKACLALSLFGGCAKDYNNKHRIRGDINVLMLGDPGTAKSQFLKYVEQTAHRAVFTTGQGASAVGLTASVRKDPMTKEWTLEGGALVLADKGVCLIDEFDKMNDQDRTSIHEAMEQQTISISKAGIVTTLQARCAVIAAANPIRGRYNPSIPFSQNVELTDPILSRFDALCVVKDEADPLLDEQLGRFVVESHMRSHPDFMPDELETTTTLKDDDIIPQDLLRKYIMYAKENVVPKIHQIDEEKVTNFYAQLRQESVFCGGIPITVRHLESIARMSEARAKMHLRDFVRSDDVDFAIKTLLRSFTEAQKYAAKVYLRKKLAKYLSYDSDRYELLLHFLKNILMDHIKLYQLKHKGQSPDKISIPIQEFESKASEKDIHDIYPFCESTLFAEGGFVLNREAGLIVKDLA
ncbi:MCM DNA helicase complex subunit [Basidiobolus ranarum]|uniref:DNA replication licensing factor MCM2 n=1 Tax=Basidiobolus ranarum TaxID=34480 RepID=A0ABR2WAC1_9FUNG